MRVRSFLAIAVVAAAMSNVISTPAIAQGTGGTGTAGGGGRGGGGAGARAVGEEALRPLLQLPRRIRRILSDGWSLS